MRRQGQVSNWNDDRGFGFITPEGGGEQVFAHISAFTDRRFRPEGGEVVSYELVQDAEGRARARAVAYAGRHRVRRLSGPKLLALGVALGFLLFVLLAVRMGRLPIEGLWFYLAASVVAFLAYALDKSAAVRNQWRTQESTLHLFGLLGGWPGALVAQQMLRHKSAKTSFQVTFWITVALNCAALAWLLSPDGASWLQVALTKLRGLWAG
ncbi:DUF1294 domain-containing protein [Pseudothauera nasutitermitis]|uniref:DUF1294 domain-containing protein n=1 Tax=Pseudothauera nasutitermitis TaxID=2565930 RepID=A0A4S4B294_9RHOO|nr:cold shock and DUF1294 domain-containing protein [Pseudothauera nasutitermitis]THF65807.1 DUF1294 domain-containing protein [Pseudothauera nasutitermitis]